MTATGHISRILVFVSLIVALWVGTSALSAATVSTPASTSTTRLADGHSGCC